AAMAGAHSLAMAAGSGGSEAPSDVRRSPDIRRRAKGDGSRCGPLPAKGLERFRFASPTKTVLPPWKVLPCIVILAGERITPPLPAVVALAPHAHRDASECPGKPVDNSA
ncbi:MAG: hypothetical protein AB7O44_27595, partial [Hyphomicrobiaceae bacterium]